MKILDATTGFKGIWYQKNHPFVTFMDQRKETVESPPNAKIKNKRRYRINPDIVSTWENAPFPDNYFDMIIFDPPHIVVKNKNAELSTMKRAYGYLNHGSWKKDMKKGIDKLFKILKPEGIFILKWSETDINVNEVLKLFPYQPLFGSNTRSKVYTANFWIVFLKYDVNMKLTGIQT